MEKLNLFKIELADKATFMAHLLSFIHKVKQLDFSYSTILLDGKKFETLLCWNELVCIMLYSFDLI